jgi:hypothetical protein
MNNYRQLDDSTHVIIRQYPLIRNQQVGGSRPPVGQRSTEISFFQLTAKLTGSFFCSNIHYEYILRRFP